MPESFELATLTDTVTALVTDWGLSVVGALVVLVLGRMVAGWTRRFTNRALTRGKVDETLVPFISGVTYTMVLVFVGIAVLGIFGIPTASFVAVLGAAGLAIGLAFQSTFSNFASGVMLLIFRPIHTGDFVDVGGTTGIVQEIGIFSTILDTPDNVRIIVPNSGIFGQTITNYSANPTRRIDLTMGVGYDDDLSVVVRTIEGVLAGDPRVLEKPVPVVAVAELADSSVNLVVRPWCNAGDYWDLRFDLTRAMKEQLEAAGCNIPYPQADVHLHQPSLQVVSG